MGLKNTKNKTKGDKKNTFRIILAAIMLVGSIGLGVLASTFANVINVYEINKNNSGNTTTENTKGSFSQLLSDLGEAVVPMSEPVNILFMGSDVGYTQRGKKDDSVPTRSDSMIVAHIDPKEKKVTALSIPRDTRVLLPEKNYYDKINAALAYGGEKYARRVVANLTGMPIHHYVLLKVDGLMNIIDALGGVDIFIDKDMKYTDWTAKLFIKLKKGQQHLDGKQSHQYLRFRHDEIGDIGRVQRQQKFVNAMSAKLMNPATILKLPELVSITQRNVISDLSNGEMLKIGNFLRKLKKDDVRMVMLPGRFGEIDGVSYWVPDDLTTKETVKDLFPDSIFNNEKTDSNSNTIEQIDKRKYKLTVLNGTSESGLASKAARVLKEKGWLVWNVEQADNTNTQKTQIILQTGKTKAVPQLSSDLNLVETEVINASTGDLFTDYTITVGKDFSVALKKKQEELDVVSNKQLKR